jgi:glycerophosphoryl diester phosphodiesterase
MEDAREKGEYLNAFVNIFIYIRIKMLDPMQKCFMPVLFLMMGADAQNLNSFDIQGHRGDRGNVPPGNTMPSFESAVELGVTTLEGDMQITADGRVVMGHDDGIGGSCVWAGGGTGPSPNISGMTAVEVAQWDCHAELAGIQPPPALEQVLDLGRGNDIQFNLEFKQRTILDVDIYMPAIITYNDTCGGCLEGRMILQCFNWSALEYAKTTYYDQAAYGNFTFRLSVLGAGPIQDASVYADIYSPDFTTVDQGVVDEAHTAGMQIIPWTVNNTADMENLINLGVDGIITDYPDRLQYSPERLGALFRRSRRFGGNVSGY